MKATKHDPAKAVDMSAVEQVQEYVSQKQDAPQKHTVPFSHHTYDCFEYPPEKNDNNNDDDVFVLDDNRNDSGSDCSSFSVKSSDSEWYNSSSDTESSMSYTPRSFSSSLSSRSSRSSDTNTTATLTLPAASQAFFKLNLKEEAAKTKLVHILKAIEKTKFATTTGQLLHTQGGTKITTSKGEEKIIGDTAYEIWALIKNKESTITHQEIHEKAKSIAASTQENTWSNYYSKNVTRTVATTELYKNIAEDKIGPTILCNVFRM